MSTEAPFKPPRKKPNVFWLLGGFFLLLFLFFIIQLFGPNPPIVVSSKTTYITEPLGADGLPDYEKYVLGMYRNGVTPENNAAALLWRALWPGELDPPQYAAVANELGLKEIPSKDDALVAVSGKVNRARIATWLRDQEATPATQKSAPAPGTSAEVVTDDNTLASEGAIDERGDELFRRAMSQPWTSKQIPPLAKWAADNKKPLDLMVAASQRPRCYLPSPSLLNGKQESLIEMLLPGAQAVREAGRSLSTRAMWHVGEGRPDDAWRDLLAAHRIGHLTAQGSTIVEQLVGMAIDGIAREGTLALLDRGSLSADQARQVQRDLASIQTFNNMADCLNSLERLSYLDACIQLALRKNVSLRGYAGVGEQMSYVNLVSVDWNVVLRKGNEFYDRLVAAARLPDHPARKQAFQQFESDLNRLMSDVREPGTLFGGIVNPARRNEIVASIMLGMFLPAVSAATAAEDRANSFLELERLAAALAVHRAEHGAYPEKLEELVPGVLEKLPVELYNAKPFIYKRTDDGYLLYSAGENGQDDGGSNERTNVFQGRELDDLESSNSQQPPPQIPSGADDISIRVPRPPFRLPTIPARPAGEP